VVARILQAYEAGQTREKN